MYLVYYRPLIGKVANYVEIGSELITLLLMYHLLLFTDFVPDPVVRYEIGYPFTYLMAAFIIVQLIFLFLTTLVRIQNRTRKWLAKRKAAKKAKVYYP